MTYKLLQIGTDAELFLKSLTTSEPVPVCGMFGGTKESPLPVLGGGGYAVQEDNVMLEFNVPPADSAQEFANSLTKMISFIDGECLKKGVRPEFTSEMTFKQEQLNSKQAQTFGCEPDFCVWTREENEIDKSDPKLLTFRCSGFHIHTSYTVNGAPPKLSDMELVIMLQDIMIAAPLIMRLSDSGDRRNFYGRAGAFRPKHYGHEYRVLGGSVLKDSLPTLSQWIFGQTNSIFNMLNRKEAWARPQRIYQFLHKYRDSVENAINKGDMSSLEYLNRVQEARAVF